MLLVFTRILSQFLNSTQFFNLNPWMRESRDKTFLEINLPLSPFNFSLFELSNLCNSKVSKISFLLIKKGKILILTNWNLYLQELLICPDNSRCTKEILHKTTTLYNLVLQKYFCHFNKCFNFTWRKSSCLFCHHLK